MYTYYYTHSNFLSKSGYGRYIYYIIIYIMLTIQVLSGSGHLAVKKKKKINKFIKVVFYHIVLYHLLHLSYLIEYKDY